MATGGSLPLAPSPELVGVINLLEELVAVFGEVPVDCEFAVTNEDGQDVLWLLQARPLVLPHVPSQWRFRQLA